MCSGQRLPYAGYIEAEIEIPGKDVSQTSLFLVVPETDYSSSVPVLVGTDTEANEGKLASQIWTKILAESCFGDYVVVSFSTPGSAAAAAETGKWTGRCSEVCY